MVFGRLLISCCWIIGVVLYLLLKGESLSVFPFILSGVYRGGFVGFQETPFDYTMIFKIRNLPQQIYNYSYQNYSANII